MNDKMLGNIAKKNGWDGTGSPVPYLPLTLLGAWKEAPKGSDRRGVYEYIESRLADAGLSLGMLARYQPNRTLADLVGGDIHTQLGQPPMPQPQPQPQPGHGPQGQPKPGQQQGEQDGQDEQEGQEGQAQQQGQQQGQGQQQQGQGQQQQKQGGQGMTPAQAQKQAREELAKQLTKQRKQTAKEQQAQSQLTVVPPPLDPDSEGAHQGGIVEQVIHVPPELIRTMNAIVQRMVGGFDLTMTPMWDSNELVKRMVARRPLDPARRYEDGRPAFTLACDISGSCWHISNATTAVSIASSMSGEAGADIWVTKHDNGDVKVNQNDIDPEHLKKIARNPYMTEEGKSAEATSYVTKTISWWTYRNGRRVNLSEVAKQIGCPLNGEKDWGNARKVFYALNGIQNMPKLSSPEYLLMQDTGRADEMDPHMTRSFNPAFDEIGAATSADILLCNNPAWLIVFTDTDALKLLEYLLAFAKEGTNIVWVDYRTIPNREVNLNGARYLASLRMDGQLDNRFSEYMHNHPTYPGGKFWSSNDTEYQTQAEKIALRPTHAYSPRYVGDTHWIPMWWGGSYFRDVVGKHKRGRQFTVIPNCDHVLSIIEAMKIVAAPELLVQAKQAGESNMRLYEELGLLDAGYPSRLVSNYLAR